MHLFQGAATAAAGRTLKVVDRGSLADCRAVNIVSKNLSLGLGFFWWNFGSILGFFRVFGFIFGSIIRIWYSIDYYFINYGKCFNSRDLPAKNVTRGRFDGRLKIGLSSLS